MRKDFPQQTTPGNKALPIFLEMELRGPCPFVWRERLLEPAKLFRLRIQRRTPDVNLVHQ